MPRTVSPIETIPSQDKDEIVRLSFGKAGTMNISLTESYAYSQTLARRAAKNFYFSFLGLPPDLFRSMCALYAFLHVSDDIGDNVDVPVTERRETLQRWSTSLRRALDGDHFDHEVFPALQDVVRRHNIPEEYLFSVIEGVRMDLDDPCFETFDDLSNYCYHVAGTVGLCCIHIWGFEGENAYERAKACGLAFQLTNILRDLAEDARMGRTYLPQEDLRRFNYSSNDIRNQVRDTRFHNLMTFEVTRAQQYYGEAEMLFECLEPVGRPILRAMLRVYGGLLTQIERRNYDVFSRPITLPHWQKLLIATDAIIRHRWLRLRCSTCKSLDSRGLGM